MAGPDIISASELRGDSARTMQGAAVVISDWMQTKKYIQIDEEIWRKTKMILQAPDGIQNLKPWFPVCSARGRHIYLLSHECATLSKIVDSFRGQFRTRAPQYDEYLLSCPGMPLYLAPSQQWLCYNHSKRNSLFPTRHIYWCSFQTRKHCRSCINISGIS